MLLQGKEDFFGPPEEGGPLEAASGVSRHLLLPMGTFMESGLHKARAHQGPFLLRLGGHQLWQQVSALSVISCPAGKALLVLFFF